MDPTPVQREPLPNQVGGNAEYFIRATVDASNYINLLDGNSKTFFVDSFAVRTDVNDYFLQFQITATLRNTGGEYYADLYMSPINAVLIHLSASVQVWKIFEKLHVNLQTHFAFKYRVPQQVWNWLNVLKLKIVLSKAHNFYLSFYCSFQATSPEGVYPGVIQRRIYDKPFANGFIGSLWLHGILRTLNVEVKIHQIGMTDIEEFPNDISRQINR